MPSVPLTVRPPDFPIAVYLSDEHSKVEVLLYADGLLIVISAQPEEVADQLLRCLRSLNRFSLFSGLIIYHFDCAMFVGRGVSIQFSWAQRVGSPEGPIFWEGNNQNVPCALAATVACGAHTAQVLPL